MVGILVLIHHDVIKLILILLPYFGHLLQQAQCQEQQIIKIHRIIGSQLALVGLVNLSYLFFVKISCLGGKFLYPQQFILSIANAADNPCRLVTFFVQIHFLENLLEQIFRVSGIINSKIITILA